MVLLDGSLKASRQIILYAFETLISVKFFLSIVKNSFLLTIALSNFFFVLFTTFWIWLMDSFEFHFFVIPAFSKK